MVQDALSVIDAAGLRTVIPCSASHSGWVAIELRRRLGERIPAIVHLDWMVQEPSSAYMDLIAELQDPDRWPHARDTLFDIWRAGVESEAIDDALEVMRRQDAEMWMRSRRQSAAGAVRVSHRADGQASLRAAGDAGVPAGAGAVRGRARLVLGAPARCPHAFLDDRGARRGGKRDRAGGRRGELGVTPDADSARHARGLASYASQFGIAESEVAAHLGALIGDRMAGEAISSAGGGAWEEGTLTLRERSMIVLASLITQGGADARLRGHVRWAVQHGVTAEQIEELATLLTIYAGFPRATTAMELIRAELAALEGQT
jgi:alkylhydroperoxidase/carboxymuconolactone decarboxylase family protein YurZ